MKRGKVNLNIISFYEKIFLLLNIKGFIRCEVMKSMNKSISGNMFQEVATENKDVV